MAPDRLPPQDWMALASTRAVVEALEAAGGAGCARFVGGCVRDSLLGRTAPGGAGLDIDLATPLTPAEVTHALERAGLRAAPTGVAHGTVTAIAAGRPFEITTLRRDVETDGRRAVVAFTHDWSEDAARRDFRMNALYAAPDGALFDPTGAGVADALAGRVVFVGEAQTRIREDYLRILRFFRFGAWYGRAAPDAAGLAACARLAGGIAGLSGERIAKELLRLLAAPEPRPAVAAMAQARALAVCAPGLPADATGLARFDRLVALQIAWGEPPEPLLRLAALLPDDPAAVAAAAARLRLSKAQTGRLAAAAAPGAPIDAGLSPAGARRRLYAIGASAFRDRLRLGWAAQAPSAADGDAAAWRALDALAQGWSPPPFPVSGDEIVAAGAPQGPRVGEVRRALERWWIEGDFRADRAAALAEARRLAQASHTSDESSRAKRD